MSVKAWVMAASNVSRVRAAVLRKLALNFDQHSSMGDRSGEYGGKYWYTGEGGGDCTGLIKNNCVHYTTTGPDVYANSTSEVRYWDFIRQGHKIDGFCETMTLGGEFRCDLQDKNNPTGIYLKARTRVLSGGAGCVKSAGLGYSFDIGGNARLLPWLPSQPTTSTCPN